MHMNLNLLRAEIGVLLAPIIVGILVFLSGPVAWGACLITFVFMAFSLHNGAEQHASYWALRRANVNLRLLSLINDILDLAKVEAGKMELNLSAIAIAELIEQSLAIVKEQCQKKNIGLHVEFDPALSDLTLQADERKLKQIMFNLLSNAVKFTPDQGSSFVFTIPVKRSEAADEKKGLAAPDTAQTA